MIYRNVPLPTPANWRSEILVGSGATVRDLSIDSNAIYRGLAGTGGDDYGINASGSGGWLIERILVQHCDAQWLGYVWGARSHIHGLAPLQSLYVNHEQSPRKKRRRPPG
jgi:hypothetical protein